MKLNGLTKITRTFTVSTFAVAAMAASAVYADARPRLIDDMSQRLSAYTLDCGHWYVGANLGVSRLHDDPNPNSGNNVNEYGPGGSIVGGYQFNSIAGLELGYTKYSDSKEYSSTTTMVARTEHYSVDLAGTARYPLVNAWSALGKLGVAYSYAQKIAEASGTARSSNTASLYWGLGLDYSLTPRVDFIAQFAEAVGNNSTGSADLWSLGMTVAIA